MTDSSRVAQAGRDAIAQVSATMADDACPVCSNPFDADPPQKCGFCGKILDPVRLRVANFDKIFCDGCGTQDFGYAIELTFAAKPRLTLSLCEKCGDEVEKATYVAVRQVRDLDHAEMMR